MLDILSEVPKIREEYEELEQKMGNPDVIEGSNYQEISQKYSKIKDLLQLVEELEDVTERIDENEEMLESEDDEEMIELVREELAENKERREELIDMIKEKSEDTKVAIRNIRRETKREIENMEEDGEITEDDKYLLEDEIDDTTKEYTEKVDDLIEQKAQQIRSI